MGYRKPLAYEVALLSAASIVAERGGSLEDTSRQRGETRGAEVAKKYSELHQLWPPDSQGGLSAIFICVLRTGWWEKYLPGKSWFYFFQMEHRDERDQRSFQQFHSHGAKECVQTTRPVLLWAFHVRCIHVVTKGTPGSRNRACARDPASPG